MLKKEGLEPGANCRLTEIYPPVMVKLTQNQAKKLGSIPKTRT
jgi:hypothetical protein